MTIARMPHCWVTLKSNEGITVLLETLQEYGVHPGDHTLSVRGSRLALGFCANGSLIDEAREYQFNIVQVIIYLIFA